MQLLGVLSTAQQQQPELNCLCARPAYPERESNEANGEGVGRSGGVDAMSGRSSGGTLVSEGWGCGDRCWEGLRISLPFELCFVPVFSFLLSSHFGNGGRCLGKRDDEGDSGEFQLLVSWFFLKLFVFFFFCTSATIPCIIWRLY